MSDNHDGEEKLLHLDPITLQLCDTFLQHITDPISIVDGGFRVLWTNQAKAALHGLKQVDMVGRICYEMYYGAEGPCEKCPVEEAVAVGRPRVVERHWGGGCWSEMRAYPMCDERGKVPWVMVYGFDITERKSGRETRGRQIEDLERKLAVVAGDRSRVPSREEAEAPPFNLTERDLEVLHLMAKGLTNLQIAEALAISAHTVKTHVTHIFNKLSVNDRTQAAVLAAFYELIPPPEMITDSSS